MTLCKREEDLLSNSLEEFKDTINAVADSVEESIDDVGVDDSPEVQQKEIKDQWEDIVDELAVSGVFTAQDLSKVLGTPVYNEKERIEVFDLVFVGSVLWGTGNSDDNIFNTRKLYQSSGKSYSKLEEVFGDKYGRYFTTVSKIRINSYISRNNIPFTNEEVNSMEGEIIDPSQIFQQNVNGQQITFVKKEEFLDINLSLDKAETLSGHEKDQLIVRIFKVGIGDFSIFYSNLFKRKGLSNDQISLVFGLGGVDITYIENQLTIAKIRLSDNDDETYVDVEKALRRIVANLSLDFSEIPDKDILQELETMSGKSDIEIDLLNSKIVNDINTTLSSEGLADRIRDSVSIPSNTFFASTKLLSKVFDSKENFRQEVLNVLAKTEYRFSISDLSQDVQSLESLLSQDSSYIEGTATKTVLENDSSGVASISTSLDAPYSILGRGMDIITTFSLRPLFSDLKTSLVDYPKTSGVVEMLEVTLFAKIELLRKLNESVFELSRDIEHIASLSANLSRLPLNYTPEIEETIRALESNINSLTSYYSSTVKEINVQISDGLDFYLEAQLDFLDASDVLSEEDREKVNLIRSIFNISTAIQRQINGQQLTLTIKMPETGKDTNFLKLFSGE